MKKCLADNPCFPSPQISHYKQYPPDMTTLKAYFESRGGAYSETVFFGLQYLIKRHLVGRRVTKEVSPQWPGR